MDGSCTEDAKQQLGKNDTKVNPAREVKEGQIQNVFLKRKYFKNISRVCRIIKSEEKQPRVCTQATICMKLE